MRSAARGILTLLVCLSCPLAAQNTPPLDVLIEQILTRRSGDSGGISDEQSGLAKQIQAHGVAAVPPVLKLLNHEKEDMRKFAGYIVRDLEGLAENDLDALIAAVKRGDRWVPPAIARIGSPRAVKFLLDEFRAKPEFGTQLTWALTLCGEKAVPDLLDFLRTWEAPKLGDSDAIEEILTSPNGAGLSAVSGLRTIVRDERLSVEKRRRAIHILGRLGPVAAESVTDLKQVADANRAAFSGAVNFALKSIGTSEALPELLRLLRANPGGLALRDIAALGSNGHRAGPSILPYFDHEDWNVRVFAARAMGHIGYQGAAPKLIKLLEDPNDWRLVYAAAESLGRLKTTDAATALEGLAERHWFPPVRVAATRALRSIGGQQVYQPRRPPSEYFAVFADYLNEGDSKKMEEPESLPDFVREPGVLAESALKRMSYEIPYVIPSINVANRMSSQTLQPNRGIRFGDICLLGSDGGEFGGELAYRDNRGLTWTLIRANVHGIHQMPFGVVVTTGHAHLMSNRGTTWLVQLKPGAAPIFKQFKVLPGAPQRSGILKNGDLYIECNGGNVIISSVGEIRLASGREN